MKVLIIEDEIPAANQLVRLLRDLVADINVLDVLESVEDAVEWLQNNPHPDLCFMDIQLADGLSFEIFHHVKFESPVIFTTAFDQYALRAFRVNGLDYLLKPIEETQLMETLKRFQSLKKGVSGEEVEGMLLELQQKTKRYRERFLVKIGEQLRFVLVEDVAWLQADSGYVNLHLDNGNKILLDKSLDQVREDLDPDQFFQVNRKTIVHIKSVGKIFTYLNSRLKLELSPAADAQVIVSRDRVKGFKEWLDR